MARNTFSAEYYGKIFPVQAVADWIGGFAHREWSFGVLDRGKKEVILRNVRFDHPQDMRVELRNRSPITRLDIGGLYDNRPENEKDLLGSHIKWDIDCFSWRCKRCEDLWVTKKYETSCEQCCFKCRSDPKNICAACYDGKMVPNGLLLRDVLVHKAGLGEGSVMGFSGGRSIQFWTAPLEHPLVFACADQRQLIYDDVLKLYVDAGGYVPPPSTDPSLPREKAIDEGPAVDPGHLMRCPFSINTHTNRLAVPLDPDNCTSTNAFCLPTIETVNEHVKWLKR